MSVTNIEGSGVENKGEQTNSQNDYANKISAYKEIKASVDGLNTFDPFKSFSLRKGAVDILSSSVNAEKTAESVAPIYAINENERNHHNPAFVKVVAKDTRYQQGVIGGSSVVMVNSQGEARVVIDRSNQSKVNSDQAAPGGSSVVMVNSQGEARVVTAQQHSNLLNDSLSRFREHGLQGKAEGVENLLEEKKKGLLERLKGFGLKSVDSYKNMKPWQKVAVGVALAGAAVATGGITSIFSKALSVASSSRGFYESILKKEQEQGNANVNKTWLGIKSVLYGSLFAFATNSLFEVVAGSESARSLGENISEKTATLKDGIKSFFGFGDTVSTGVGVDSYQGGSGGPEYEPATDSNVGVDEAPEVVEANSVHTGSPVEPLPDYTIQPGDSLTKIIKEQVIAKLENVDLLTEFQKENMVQNLLKVAAENRGDATFETLNQFANPNAIHVGGTIDLNAIRESLDTQTFSKFGGQTLLEHAQSVQGEIAATPLNTSDSFSGGRVPHDGVQVIEGNGETSAYPYMNQEEDGEDSDPAYYRNGEPYNDDDRTSWQRSA